MRKFLVLFVLLLVATLGFSQELTNTKPIISDHTVYTSAYQGNAHYKIDCEGWGFFSDRPGVDKPYQDTSNYYTTICPTDAKKGIVVDFQQFAMEKYDKILIYDENRNTAVTAETLPKKDDFVKKWTGNASPGTITSKKGCLTFHFQSDETVVRNGWYAKVTCTTLAVADPCKDFKKLIDSDLKCGVKIVDNNHRGKNNYEYYGDCTMPGWPASGRELIYKIRNYHASDLVITFNEHNGSQPKKLNMFVLNDCNPNACVNSINRPAQNGSQNVNQVVIKNAPAGDYYIVIDGNKPSAHNQFDLLVECTGGTSQVCENAVYYNDFDYYRPGASITTISHYWSKRGNNRSAYLSDDKSSNGNQSLEFNRADEGIQNVNLSLDDKFKGVYRIAFDWYVEPHHKAFFGLFGGDNSDPWGSISKTIDHGDTKFQGRWFDVELFVDLDKNKYTLYSDNRCYSTSGDYHLNLENLNFYSLPKAHFYVDNICYSKVSRIPSSGKFTKVLPESLSEEVFAEKEALRLAETKIESDANSLANTIVNAPINKLDDLKITPNPSKGLTIITLGLEQEENLNLQLFSQTGQIVRSIQLGKTQFINEELDLSDLPNGLYLLRATGEKSVITKKIVLQQ